MTAEPAAAAVLTEHLHPLDVGAMNPIAELPDKRDHRHALPFHVRTIEIKAGNAAVASFVHCLEIIIGRFQIAHSAFAGMAFEIKCHAVFLAGVEDRAEAFDEQFEADVAHVGDFVSADVAGQRWKQKEMTPTVGWRTDKTRHRYLAILQLTEIMGQADN